MLNVFFIRSLRHVYRGCWITTEGLTESLNPRVRCHTELPHYLKKKKYFIHTEPTSKYSVYCSSVSTLPFTILQFLRRIKKTLSSRST